MKATPIKTVEVQEDFFAMPHEDQEIALAQWEGHQLRQAMQFGVARALREQEAETDHQKQMVSALASLVAEDTLESRGLAVELARYTKRTLGYKMPSEVWDYFELVNY